MRICIIAEGSYPYVTGGVSSWIQTLILSMPDVEFVIYAIGAERQQQGKFKYTLPPNLIHVHEVFLDAHVEQVKKRWGTRYNLTDEKKKDLFSFLGNVGEIDWENFFRLLRSRQFKNVGDFLTSKDYYDMIQHLAQTKYSQVPFTELYWTVCSMIIPLFSIVREEIPDADIYHAVSTGYAGIVGSLAKVIKGKPLLLTEHGIYTREREEEIIKANWVKGYFKDLWINYFYSLSRSIYELADEVITLFGRNKEIQIELGCAEEKIKIIPNGIDIEDFKMITRTLPDDRIRIGAIVRVVPIKDIKMMIQMFSVVERNIPTAELYILGPMEENSDYFNECIELMKSLGVKNIFFTGLADIKAYLGNLDILVLTSISEGQPLAVLEGFAAAKPYELIEGPQDEFGAAGYIVRVMHYEEMANYVMKLCNDKSLREEMGQNGFNRVKTHYKKSDFITAYTDIYMRLAGGVKLWPV